MNGISLLRLEFNRHDRTLAEKVFVKKKACLIRRQGIEKIKVLNKVGSRSNLPGHNLTLSEK